MMESAARRRFIGLGAVFLAATMFAWVAIVNGYPVVFSDSARYIDGSIRHYIPSEAPIFYGIFMIPLHLDGVSLWPVVCAQCLILAYVIRVTLRALDLLDERTFLLLSAFLAVFTSVPWFTAYLMPDFFTPISVLTMFALFRGWEKFGRLERVLLIGLALVGLTSHATHIVLGLGLAVLFCVLRLCGRRPNRTALLVVLVLPPVALSAVVGMNFVAKRHLWITQDGVVFLLARAFADGPAYDYMRDHCAERRWRVCADYQKLPRDAEHFLWGTPRSVWSAGSQSEVRAEAAEIVRGTLQEHPGEMLLAALRNALEQLVTFRAGVDFRSWPETADGGSIAAVVHRFFPQEFGQYMHSLQQQGRLGATTVNYAYSTIVLLSAIGVLVLMLRTRLDADLAEFLLVVAVALVVNAGTTGALSMVADRYQARIVWLAPLAFALSLLAYQRQRAAGPVLRVDRSLEGNA
jgi:hypothetical protein